ncbi:MAG: class I SAM-dependent methyltransferase, partial [Paracoccaceae bacterium]|nr:class I SAM-dependent methyltransferase [Paracoccaceae bacterium]
PFVLAEPGPGRGTLMADILRAASRVDGFVEAAEVHLVELSPRLRAAQRAALGGQEPTWHDHLGTLPERPLFLVANEFFDALPIRQFLRDGAGWRERVVGVANGALAFGLTDPAPLGALAHRLDDTGDGDLVELCTGAVAAMDEIARRIAAHGGAAIVCDYGGEGAPGDTLQAIADGARTGPLDRPGEADLTAHVDFAALARAARAAGAEATPVVPQGLWLERLGITARARRLAAAGDVETVAATHRRLTHADEMGHLFKAIAIHRRSTPPPPGFLP